MLCKTVFKSGSLYREGGLKNSYLKYPPLFLLSAFACLKSLIPHVSWSENSSESLQTHLETV